MAPSTLVHPQRMGGAPRDPSVHGRAARASDADAEPAWWLNLQAHPDAIVELKNGSRAIRPRAAEGEERTRLWAKVRDYSGYGDDVDAYATLRSSETAVVVLEPRPDF